MKHKSNWIDGKREEFLKNYNNLPQSSRRMPQLRERMPILHLSFREPSSSSQPKLGLENISERKKKDNWSDKDLRQSINALDCGYKMHEFCEAFNIPRSTFRDHYNGRIKRRKMRPKVVFTKEKEEKLVDYLVDIGGWHIP